jgi:hypothetical protein
MLREGVDTVWAACKGCVLACERKKKRPAVMRPLHVICMSPCLRPLRYSADIMYAVTRQLSASTLKTC